MPTIHIHNHVRAAGGTKASKPKMVSVGTQYDAADIDPKAPDPRKGFKAKVRRFRHRMVRWARVAAGTMISVGLFYARRVNLGINVADFFFGGRRR